MYFFPYYILGVDTKWIPNATTNRDLRYRGHKDRYGVKKYYLKRGKREEQIVQMQVYPNPANHLLTIAGYQLMHTNLGYEIFDMLGQSMLKGILKDEKTTIDISSLSSGIYFVRVNNESKKFVKE